LTSSICSRMSSARITEFSDMAPDIFCFSKV
jgi:hypothetical protein